MRPAHRQHRFCEKVKDLPPKANRLVSSFKSILLKILSWISMWKKLSICFASSWRGAAVRVSHHLSDTKRFLQKLDVKSKSRRNWLVMLSWREKRPDFYQCAFGIPYLRTYQAYLCMILWQLEIQWRSELRSFLANLARLILRYSEKLPKIQRIHVCWASFNYKSKWLCSSYVLPDCERQCREILCHQESS